MDDDEGNEIDLLYSSIALPSNIEVDDAESESGSEFDGDEYATDEPKVKKRKSGKASKSRKQKEPRKRKVIRKPPPRGQPDSPEWFEFDQQAAEPAPCAGTFSPPPRAMTPYQYFSTLFTEEIMVKIALESNRYCIQKLDYDPHITMKEIQHREDALFSHVLVCGNAV